MIYALDALGVDYRIIMQKLHRGEKRSALASRVHSKQNNVSEHGKRSEVGGTSYNGVYREVLPERGTFFRLHVPKRVEISQGEIYESVIWLF